MERFSSATLSAIADEVALQGHLLSRAFLVEVADGSTPDDVRTVGIAQAAGIAGLTAKRLAAAIAAPPDLAGVAAVLAVHPLLLPRSYVAARLDDRDEELVLTLLACPALDEPDGLTWAGLLAGDGGDAIIDAVACCLVPTAVVGRRDAADGGGVAWTIAAGGPERTQPDTVTLTEFSTGAAFAFGRR